MPVPGDNIRVSLPPDPSNVEVMAADELAGGVKVQRVKVGFGADGSYGDVTLTNPLPVKPPVGAVLSVTIPSVGSFTVIVTA